MFWPERIWAQSEWLLLYGGASMQTKCSVIARTVNDVAFMQAINRQQAMGSERIERDFQIAHAIVFGFRQLAATYVHLYRWQ